MNMSGGRKAAAIVLSIILGAVLLLRIIFLFIFLRLRSHFRSRRFYRAMRRNGVDRRTAQRFLGVYRRQNIPSLKKIASMVFRGKGLSFHRKINHKPY